MAPQYMNKATQAGEIHSLNDMVNYIEDAMVNKLLVKKTTGEIQFIAYDTNEGQPASVSPFTNFFLLLEGSAIITIQDVEKHIYAMQFIVIPAHCIYSIKPLERFKMLSVIIKSGYE